MGVFMAGWSGRRWARYGQVLVGAGLLVGCHRHLGGLDNSVTRPIVTYRTPTILATAGQPFTSVAPDYSAYVHYNGVGTFITTGITFSVTPDLPADLVLDPATGLISGTPAAATLGAPYLIAATNSGGTGLFTLNLGIQAASPVAPPTYGGDGAAAGAVGVPLVLNPPTVPGGVPSMSGFGVSPALPAGLVLNKATGLVSGTPTATDPGTNYALTLTTPAGCANATFTLLVATAPSPAPQGLTCPDLAATSGQPFSGPLPTLASGTDVVYTINPALPAGLDLDPLTGQVTGTPTASSPQAPYTLTASGATGQVQATIQVTVS
jgi:hypothetical protein